MLDSPQQSPSNPTRLTIIGTTLTATWVGLVSSTLCWATEPASSVAVLRPALAAVGPLADEARQQTVAYLRSLQNHDGGFAAQLGQPSHLTPTSTTLRALTALRSAPPDRASARQYILSCCHEGAISPVPGLEATCFSTSVGIMGLLAVAGPNDPAINLVIGDALTWLSQNARSFEDVRIAVAAFAEVGRPPPAARREAWIDLCRQTLTQATKTEPDVSLARTAGGAAAALMRLNVPAGEFAATAELFARTQHTDGGWRATPDQTASTLEATYRIMRCRHGLSGVVAPDENQKARVAAFVRACRNPDGGYGLWPGQPSSASATYYAITILGWVVPSSP